MRANLIQTLSAAMEARIPRLLTPGETIELKIGGILGEGLVCTNRRAIILKTGNSLGSKTFYAPYQRIKSVDVSCGSLFGVFEIVADGDCAPIDHKTAMAIATFEMKERFQRAAAFIMQKVLSSGPRSNPESSCPAHPPV